MKISYRNSLPALAVLALCSATAHAESSDSAVAQALFDQAKQLMATGHSAEACPKLEESQHLDPRSGTLINLASCYEQTARLASAWSTYIEAATSAKAQGNSAREAVARQRAAALAPRLPKLTISVAPALKHLAGLEITRDGVVVREPEWGLPLPADPGQHEITAKAPARASFETKVKVAGEGTNTNVSVPELAPQAAAPSAGRTPAEPVPTKRAPADAAASTSHGLGATRTIALLAGGVGLVGIGMGTAFGLASKAKHDQAARDCNGLACPNKDALAEADAAQANGNISTVMMIVGGVGLTAGVTLWLAAPKEDQPSAELGLGLGLGTVQVRGAF